MDAWGGFRINYLALIFVALLLQGCASGDDIRQLKSADAEITRLLALVQNSLSKNDAEAKVAASDLKREIGSVEEVLKVELASYKNSQDENNQRNTEAIDQINGRLATLGLMAEVVDRIAGDVGAIKQKHDQDEIELAERSRKCEAIKSKMNDEIKRSRELHEQNLRARRTHSGTYPNN